MKKILMFHPSTAPRRFVSLVLFSLVLTACGHRRIELTPTPGMAVADTSLEILPDVTNMGSLVVVNILHDINSITTGSLLGYRTYNVGGDRSETFYYQPNLLFNGRFGCEIRDELHSIWRDLGGSLPPLDPLIYYGANCFVPLSVTNPGEKLSLKGDVSLYVEILDLAYNERRDAGFRVGEMINCNSDALLNWIIRDDGADISIFTKQTLSVFEGRCPTNSGEAILKSISAGFLQLLANDEFLETVRSMKGVAAERQEAIAEEQERERQEAIAEEQERRVMVIAREQENERQEAIRERQEAIAEEQERERQEAIAEEQERERQEAIRERQEAIAEEQERRAMVVAREQERERQEAIAEEQEREREEMERVRWGRALPLGGQIITIDSGLRNPANLFLGINGARESVVTIMTEEGSGSAFIISTDGLAITNRHVVGEDAEPGTFFRARLPSGVEVPARIMRVSETLDIALIQVLCEVSCVTLRVSMQTPRVGSDIWVVGTPLGLEFTVSKGIVSSIRFLDGATAIQTDAAANPGNSGGPIIDVDTGVVLGVLTKGLLDAEGLNFGILARDALGSVGVQFR